MLFVTVYLISGLLFFFGLRAVLAKHSIPIHKRTHAHIALITLFPLVNTLFAFIIWLEFFFGEKDED